jgi:hypothetical protein
MLWTMCSERRVLRPLRAQCVHPYFHPTWSAVLVRLGRAMPNFAMTAFYEVRRFLGPPTCFVPWRTYTPLTQEYAAPVTWLAD